jgi:hypothetical protein
LCLITFTILLSQGIIPNFLDYWWWNKNI